MDATWFIDRLEAFGDVPTTLLAGIATLDGSWRPSPTDWSLVEIVSHLVDEEIEDFRMRLRLTLEDSTAAWPPIDPQGAAIARDYASRSLPSMLTQWRAVRLDSIAWLRSLDHLDLDATHTHPRFGSMTAGDLLAAWCAHDQLHLRQLAKRLHQLAEVRGAPYDTQYAGEWTPKERS